MRIAPNRIPDEVYKQMCESHNIEFVERFSQNGMTYIRFVCPNHADKGEQIVTGENLKKSKHGCKYCANNQPKTTQEFINDMISSGNDKVTIIGEYVNSHTKIAYRCNKCGEEHEATPSFLLRGGGCPTCGAIQGYMNHRKTHEEFINEMNRLQPNIEILSTYIKRKELVKCRCKIDGMEWESYPNNLLNLSAGCPMCRDRISHGEQAIMEYLKANNIRYFHNYSFEDCKYVRKLKCDFYLPECNVVIEYDGRQHYEEVDYFNSDYSTLTITQKRDSIKNEYCANHGIKMIRIPWFEKKSIIDILDENLKQTA